MRPFDIFLLKILLDMKEKSNLLTMNIESDDLKISVTFSLF